MIAHLWCKKIINRERIFADVPNGLKERVKQALIEKGYEELILETNQGE